ncbi:MAG: hypothetical protein K0S74_197 [Chlamydiales bacterium]|jgi:hypothetical protein|nr:hypothetical protein [Chlamydiales bacterium]
MGILAFILFLFLMLFFWWVPTLLIAIVGVLRIVAFWWYFTKQLFDKKKYRENPAEQTVFIKDQQLFCSHCRHDLFFKRLTLLPGMWKTLLMAQYFTKPTSSFICCKCGLHHIFEA